MKIRIKAVIIFLILSLAPLVIVGVVAYKNGEETVKRSLGSTFRQLAHEAINKADRSLYEVYQNVRTWASLEMMQEVITGDVDNKISSFLIGVSQAYGYFAMLNAINAEGKVIASSNPELVGMDLKDVDGYKTAISGMPYMRDVHVCEITKELAVTFAFPIRSRFEEGEIVGVLFTKWRIDELFGMMPIRSEGEEEYHGHFMLMRGDGLIIAAPPFEKKDVYKRNLIKAGLKSALLASQRKEGYLVEVDEYNRKFLIGYDYSKGYHDFPSLGWSALVMEDVKIAFAPVEQLKIIIFGIGALVALFVVIISLIIAQRMTNPILNISRVATKIAQGDFEERVDYISGDEIGQLADSFNKMTEDLKELMQKEKELAAGSAAAMTCEREKAQELEKAYKELREMKDMLIQVEKLNAVGLLASGVAHEVRNPLGIIIQGVNYLETKLSSGQADIFEVLGMIRNSVKRADKIVGLLLDFSRATKLDLELEDINTILENSLNLVKTKFGFENIEMIKETKKDMPKVLVDKNRLEQVFVNALLNAIQAIPEKGKIIIRSFDKQLEVAKNGIGKRKTDSFEVGERAVMVEIEDTGVGIPEENLKKIFDPFFTTKGPSGGTGLGLSVSRNIINMHKGLINIESEPGKGTKVTITLKIAKG